MNLLLIPKLTVLPPHSLRAHLLPAQTTTPTAHDHKTPRELLCMDVHVWPWHAAQQICFDMSKGPFVACIQSLKTDETDF